MNLLIFVVALSVLVLVHEWGHFMAAKKTGVRVEEFGLGLPPRIWGKKVGDTIYSINWLPIGGFCRLYGEDITDIKKTNDRSKSFYYKNPWQKLVIVLGGVIMNLVLAVVVFGVVYTIVGVPEEVDKVSIVEVSKNSPAEMAGLKENDVILEVNGIEVKKAEALIDEVGKYKGKNVMLTVKTGEMIHESSVLVRENPSEGEGSMGVAVSNTEMKPIPWYRFDKGVVAGFKSLLSGKVPKDVSGPVGMYEATSSINDNQGILAVIHFFAIVSVNLAVVNVLPFPALDGGRIIFVLYEMITRKRANQRVEAMVNNLGMMILLALILIITVGDVKRLIGW